MIFSIIAFVLAYFVSKFLYENKVFSPGLFFIVNFTFSYMLLQASSFIYNDLNSKTNTIIVISISAFILGTLLSKATIIRIKKPMYSKDSTYEYKQDMKAITILFALFLIGAVYCMYYYISKMGLVNYFANMIRISAREIAVDINIMLYLKKIGQVLAIYSVYCIVTYREKKSYFIVILVLCVLSHFGYQRNDLFYVVTLAGLTFIYTGQKLKPTRIDKKKNSRMLIAVVLIAIGALVYFIRTQEDFNKTFKITGTIFGRSILEAFITPLSYYIGPFASTSQYLETLGDSPFLIYTGRIIYTILNGIGLIDVENFNYGVPFVSIPFSFNTALMQFYVFREGGYFWLILVYFILGYISYKWYKQYMYSRSLLHLIKLVYISFVLLFSIREYAFMRIDYIIVIIVYEIIKLVRMVRFRL